MINQTQALFTDTRHHFRVRDNRSVLWKVNNGAQKGKARIRNLSASGMMIETNGTFIPPKEGCVFSFDTTLGHDNYVPQYGQLVWSRKLGRVKNKFYCGVRFLEPSEYIQTKLRKKVQKGILRITTKRRVRMGLSAVLTALIVGLTGYTIWVSQDIYTGMSTSTDRLLDVSDKQAALSRDYAAQYQQSQQELASVSEQLVSTRELYQQSESNLQSVTVELNETKMILAQTEAMLLQAQAGSNQLAKDFENVLAENQEQFVQTKAVFEEQIAGLEKQKVRLEEQVMTLQQQLSFYEGNIDNIDEGRVLINIYKERMKVVKSKIRDFRREARRLRHKAQNERDRIQLALGNNGFLMKNGEVVNVDMEKYRAAGRAPAVVRESVAGLPPQVEIKVTNFE